MRLSETPNVAWRPVEKAEKIPTILGRPVRDAWLGEEIATLNVGFIGSLFSSTRDLAEAARDKRMLLPIQSLRAIVGHEFRELISLESTLGLDSERRQGAGSAITLFDPDQDLTQVKARVLSCVSSAREALDDAFGSVRTVAFGHLGDSNLHLGVHLGSQTLERQLEIERCVYAVVKEFAGALTAEHGIGTFKREFLPDHVAPGALIAMSRVRAALDPDHLLNRDVLF